MFGYLMILLGGVERCLWTRKWAILILLIITIFIINIVTLSFQLGFGEHTEENVNEKTGHDNSERSYGRDGKPVFINNPDTETFKLIERGRKLHAFNQYVSDLIPANRSLPDYRHPGCPRTTGSESNQLPMTSVIIVFHNEAWSTLVRTVHSVLNRSPLHLLQEILLIDDASTMNHLKEELASYVAQLPRVRLVRSQQRLGLIRARLLGYSEAVGPVLTFLDSHVEATVGWLEPLLVRIAKDPNRVVCPVIDIIDEETFEYRSRWYFGIGGFDWRMQFRWHALSPSAKAHAEQYPADPVPTPTMAGGLFSIDRQFFSRLGTYDPAFDFYGSENLELSFKVWMCGGSLEIVPCSHVGHVFRKRSPYSWGEGGSIRDMDVARALINNAVRLAEVWLDDYKVFFYDNMDDATRYIADMMEVNVEDRRQLRKSLNCKSFSWYLTHVFPDFLVPGDAVSQGEISNPASQQCLESPGTSGITWKTQLEISRCDPKKQDQHWMMSGLGEIRRYQTCLDYTVNNSTDDADRQKKHVGVRDCCGSEGEGQSQRWRYSTGNGQLIHMQTGNCLTLSRDKMNVILEKCEQNKKSQVWSLKNYNMHKLDKSLRYIAEKSELK